MKINLRESLSILACIFMLFLVADSVVAAQDSSGQNIGITVNNSGVVTPDTPIIVRSENVTTNELDLLVEVGSGYATETLDFVVISTNAFTGDITNVFYTQSVDINARTILTINDLMPGTAYDFTVRYARNGFAYSADSTPHSVATLIDAPILNTINSVTDDSAVLHVAVDPDFIGMAMDFIVEIVGGGTYTVQMTMDVTNGTVTLPIDGLNTGTNYTFRVKYAHENTLYFSDYSNNKSITTEDDDGDENLETPVIVDIKNIATTSLDLVVEIEDQDNEKCDFVVHVTNTATGEIIKIHIGETVGGNDRVMLTIIGLEPGTKYKFKVKYSLDSGNEESDYSNSKSAQTKYPSVPQMVICYEFNTITIVKSELDVYIAQGATVGVCSGTSDEQVMICYKRDTITVAQSKLQSYFDKGAIVGKCDDEKVYVCHDGKTITITKSVLQTHLDQGDILGQCPNVPSDLISGGSIDINNKKSIVDKIRDIITLENKKKTYKIVSMTGIITGAIVSLASSSIPFFTVMPGTFSSSLFLRFLELFGIIGKRKKERNWGIVFDSETRMPIPAAKIILSDQLGKELSTTYSDSDGRFGFLVNPGKYKIDVFKKNYVLVTDTEVDSLYGNTYDGNIIEIGSDNVILTNISMKIQGFDWQEYANDKPQQYSSSWSMFKKYLFFSVYVLGFGITAVVTFFDPTIFNFVMISLYILIFIYQQFSKKKKYGSITTKNGKAVPFAVVNLYEQNSNEKKAFAVTNSIGLYYLLADNGKYKLKAKGQPLSGASFEKYDNISVKNGIVRKDIVV